MIELFATPALLQRRGFKRSISESKRQNESESKRAEGAKVTDDVPRYEESLSSPSR